MKRAHAERNDRCKIKQTLERSEEAVAVAAAVCKATTRWRVGKKEMASCDAGEQTIADEDGRDGREKGSVLMQKSPREETAMLEAVWHQNPARTPEHTRGSPIKLNLAWKGPSAPARRGLRGQCNPQEADAAPIEPGQLGLAASGF